MYCISFFFVVWYSYKTLGIQPHLQTVLFVYFLSVFLSFTCFFTAKKKEEK